MTEVETPGDELLRIDSERLRATLEASSAIGRFETGLRRLALSDEDKEMRDPQPSRKRCLFRVV